MSFPQNNSSIPESITINGVTYLVKDTPELQQFIQSVAKVEKTKLYSQMENLRTQIQNLGSVEVAPSGNQVDADTLIEKLKSVFITQESLKDTIGDTIKEVVKPVIEATQRNEKKELDEYREKLIRENATTCIPDLVKGNTKEELDASLKESIRLRGAYPPAGNQAKYTGDPVIKAQENAAQVAYNNTPTPQNQPGGVQQQAQQTPQMAPAAPRIPAMEATQMEVSPRRMSVEEFAKKRGALKADLEAMYSNGNW